MIDRSIARLIREMLRAYPAVALVGPRQSGKTTLARSLDGVYFDLEQPVDRLRLDVAWETAVAGEEMLILDEAQEMPAVFPRLRATIDADRKHNGRFLLLGSISPALMQQVGESLAGRLAVCELTPFMTSELPESQWDALWHFGGYPDGGILEAARYPAGNGFTLISSPSVTCPTGDSPPGRRLHNACSACWRPSMARSGMPHNSARAWE